MIPTAENINKELTSIGVEQWVAISIYLIGRKAGQDDHQDRTLIYEYRLPRKLYERKQWIVRWRQARLQCEHPRNSIWTTHAFFDKKTGVQFEIGGKNPFTQLLGSKRTVTKIERAMEAAKKAYVPTIFAPTIQHTDEWQKASKKLLAALENRAYWQQEVDRIQEESYNKK
jgi:hypothetical protein